MSRRVFESLRVWHDARRLTSRIYTVTRSGAFAQDYGLRDQIRRASVSIMSNIAEGHERGGQKEFIHFLRIAKGSAGEVRSQLYTAQDVGYLKPELAGELRAEATAVVRRIADWSPQMADQGQQTNPVCSLREPFAGRAGHMRTPFADSVGLPIRHGPRI